MLQFHTIGNRSILGCNFEFGFAADFSTGNEVRQKIVSAAKANEVPQKGIPGCDNICSVEDDRKLCTGTSAIPGSYNRTMPLRKREGSMTIKQKQWQLYCLGYYSGVIDRIWEAGSKAAAVSFHTNF